VFESIAVDIALFATAAVAIAISGTFMSRIADQLADRTGLGEALVGTLLLAGATSLPDLAATLTAVLNDRPALAMGNVMGSMAANLAFLGIGDLVYRKANLEHASASVANLMQTVLMIALVTIALVAMIAPMDIGGIHPLTPMLVLGYLFGLHLVRGAQTSPMWAPRQTDHTVEDVADASGKRAGNGKLWVGFGIVTAITAGCGWLIMQAATGIVERGALSETVAGGVFTALGTSSPELVVTIAAVRQGALTLAVSNILGTNCFNTLIAAAADVAYRHGSIYQDVSAGERLWGLITILMASVLLLGMLRRQTFGIGRIGFESFLMLALYAGAITFAVAYGR